VSNHRLNIEQTPAGNWHVEPILCPLAGTGNAALSPATYVSGPIMAQARFGDTDAQGAPTSHPSEVSSEVDLRT